MKNRILSVLAAFAVLVSFSACQAGDTEQTAPLSEAVISETTANVKAETQMFETTETENSYNPIKFEITDWTMEELLSNISIENNTFTLPCTLSELGTSFMTEYLGYVSDYDYTTVNLYIGDKYIAQISFNGNLTENEIENSTLVAFFMDNIRGLPQFNIMGITNQSSQEEIVDILGEPNTINSEDGTIYQYAFSENERIIISFDDENNGEIDLFFIIYDTEVK